MSTAHWGSHEDRLLPSDREVRAIARRILREIEKLPIVSPHGHIEARTFVANEPFSDPSSLLITPDHYVTRLLHSSGVRLEDLGIAGTTGVVASEREIWRTLCERWGLFAGTASGYWLETELATVFGVKAEPSAASADELFDHLAQALASPGFRPRALLEEFGIEVMSTTDDPLDSLESHATLAADPTFAPRVVPTFRPDQYIDATLPGWLGAVEKLAEWSGGVVSNYEDYLGALQERRRHFIEHGAVAADHGMREPLTYRISAAEARSLFSRAVAGLASADELRTFSGHMLYEMARMSVADGLVMTIHPGIIRNHHRPTFETYGRDTGHDIPTAIDYVSGLRPVLEDFGTQEGFHLVLFSVDETVWSREIAPLAGFYPSVFIGAPWWFLDAPDAMLRFREAVTETAGFSRYSGFIDDTRAFCSIPARHDAARRIDSGYLARLVAQHRLAEDRAIDIAIDTVGAQPRRVFKL